jgi:hypothetical protein
MLRRMNGKTKVLIGLVVVVLSGAFASGAAAEIVDVNKAETKSSFDVGASNKYYLEVTTRQMAGEPTAEVTVSATKLRYKVEQLSAEYSIRTRIHPDGGFDARFPGLGRIDVRFAQSKKRTYRTPPNKYCTGYGETVRLGTFRGTIVFEGEGGFTKAKARAAKGHIRKSSGNECRFAGPEETPEISAGFRDAVLSATGTDGDDTTTFSAAGPPAEEHEGPGTGIPSVAFYATYSTERRGIQIHGIVSLDTASHFFQVPGPPKQLLESTVIPPQPFRGTATYKVESPNTASWSGDLSVTFPGLGPKPLAFPGMNSHLCEVPVCTGYPVPPPTL